MNQQCQERRFIVHGYLFKRNSEIIFPAVDFVHRTFQLAHHQSKYLNNDKSDIQQQYQGYQQIAVLMCPQRAYDRASIAFSLGRIIKSDRMAGEQIVKNISETSGKDYDFEYGEISICLPGKFINKVC